MQINEGRVTNKIFIMSQRHALLAFLQVARLFTEYDVARGILKFQCKTWEFRATSYSVNSKAIILALIKI